METGTYPNRNVPRIFTKYIHSIDRIVPILKITVVVCQLYIMLLTKYLYYGSNCEVVVSMTDTLKITKPVHVPLYRLC